jgi:hypothetical protein
MKNNLTFPNTTTMNDELLNTLQQIAGWAGNLSDERLTSRTGANDAVSRGLQVVAMRQFAIEALKKYAPEKVPQINL